MWKQERQFWFDRVPSKSEEASYGGKSPEKMRVAILLRQRDDGTMWYSVCTFWNLIDGASPLPLAKLKLENAIAHVNWCAENTEPQEPVSDEMFLSSVENKRVEYGGTYFELSALESVLEAR